MKIKFDNDELESFYSGVGLKRKLKFDIKVIKRYRDRIDLMKQCDHTQQLRAFKALHFEKLSGNRSGHYSIAVDYNYRIIFSIHHGELKINEIILIEELSNHYQ